LFPKHFLAHQPYHLQTKYVLGTQQSQHQRVGDAADLINVDKNAFGWLLITCVSLIHGM
jgi:hypothetical protein